MRTLVVGLVAALAAGCGSASTLLADDSTSGQSKSATDGSAQQVLQQAVREFVLADTGGFYSVVRYRPGGTQFTPISTTGTYQLSRQLADLTVTLNGGSSEQLTVNQILMPDQFYARVNRREEPEPCWLQYRQAQVRESRGLPSGAELAQFPPGVAAVTRARGVEFARDDTQVILGTTDLSLALGLVFPMATEAMAELSRANHTVPAEFE